MHLDIDFVCMRHPQILISRDYCYGQEDILPCPKHLEELYRENKDIIKNFKTLYSSPLKRCADLAKRFSHQVQFDERLKEISFGDWEMKKWSEIGKSPLDIWLRAKRNFTPPGGEAFSHFKMRIFQFLKEKEKELNGALLVTHSGVIRALLILLMKEDFDSIIQRRIEYGEKIRFSFKGPITDIEVRLNTD